MRDLKLVNFDEPFAKLLTQGMVLNEIFYRKGAEGRIGYFNPADADIQFELGVAELRLGRLEEAEKAFQEAVRLDPRHEDALHNLKLIDELRRRAREGEIQIE